MPDGKYAILAPAPGLKRCYQDVGGRHFETHVEAKAHARKNLIALIAEVKAPPNDLKERRRATYLTRNVKDDHVYWVYQRPVPLDLREAYPDIFPNRLRRQCIQAGSHSQAQKLADKFAARDTQLFDKLRGALRRQEEEAKNHEALQPHD